MNLQDWFNPDGERGLINRQPISNNGPLPPPLDDGCPSLLLLDEARLDEELVDDDAWGGRSVERLGRPRADDDLLRSSSSDESLVDLSSDENAPPPPP